VWNAQTSGASLEFGGPAVATGKHRESRGVLLHQDLTPMPGSGRAEPDRRRSLLVRAKERAPWDVILVGNDQGTRKEMRQEHVAGKTCDPGRQTHGLVRLVPAAAALLVATTPGAEARRGGWRRLQALRAPWVRRGALYLHLTRAEVPRGALDLWWVGPVPRGSQSTTQDPGTVEDPAPAAGPASSPCGGRSFRAWGLLSQRLMRHWPSTGYTTRQLSQSATHKAQ